MPIVTSVVLEDLPQADGRRWIREQHTDQVNRLHVRSYLVAAGVNVSDTFPATTALLNQSLKEWEFAENLGLIYARGDLATPVWTHLTLPEAGGPMREAYRQAVQAEAYALGAFLDTLTNAQLATMFGYGNPSSQLTNLRSKVAAFRTKWHEYLAAVGE
jgi:hypothetical protein